MPEWFQTDADEKVASCIRGERSFALIAGAGSGKSASLIEALELVRTEYGATLRRNGQRVACITYTNRAVEVISSRIRYDDLFVVSTIHSFLWSEVRTFTKDIRRVLQKSRIPELISRAQENDTGGQSQTAQKARKKVRKLEDELAVLDDVDSFSYDDAAYSQYSQGKLSHDDVIEVTGYLLKNRPIFRRAFGFRYPFILVDEAQDTFPVVVDALNAVVLGGGVPVVGYFGDPWQQIYDKRAGDFLPPEGGEVITKTENFRSSESVIAFLNAFRKDIKQHAARGSKGRQGSVQITLVQAEDPEDPGRRYSEEQTDRALQRLDRALDDWGWFGRDDIVRLFLVRQMIARRLGFTELNRLFNRPYASMSAKEDYESGEHFLLKPIVNAIWPLMNARRKGDERAVVDLLRTSSPAFDVRGKNRDRSLKEMIALSRQVLTQLSRIWVTGTLRDVYEYCQKAELIATSDRLSAQLARDPRTEEYDEEAHAPDKGDWLCDEYFKMRTTELGPYCDFILENTAFSTQHGVKGEEYPDVLVVFDDIEAAWRHYSFSKLLAPKTFGDPTEGQLRRSKRLAYVCFSRAMENLRVLLYTSNPGAVKKELLEQRLIGESNIAVMGT